MTQIIRDRPPNFEKILEHFPGAIRSGVIFAYAPHIYAPLAEITDELRAHEMVHIARQEEIGVDVWWDRYCTDPKFRFDEELLAHRVEYQWVKEHGPGRNYRRIMLKHIAERLSGPLYGRMVSLKKAMELIDS